LYVSSLLILSSTISSKMSLKYCSNCAQKLPLSCFLKDPLADPTSRVYSTCIRCCKRTRANKQKRSALQSLDPNIQPTTCSRPAKRVCRLYTSPLPTIQAPLPRDLPVKPPLRPSPALVTVPTEPRQLQCLVAAEPTVSTEPRRPQSLVAAEPRGFLPADKWQQIQEFNQAIEAVQIETCDRCQERGFSIDLKDRVCHRCFLQDSRQAPDMPFFMSAENSMDPGVVPSYLPELTQVKEMVIAQAHVQMLVKRVCSH
jgi:hypothetical protein